MSEESWNRLTDALERLENAERKCERIRAARASSPRVLAHKQLEKHAALARQIKETFGDSTQKCRDAKGMLDLYEENKDRVQQELDDMREALKGKEEELADAIQHLKEQQMEYQHAKLVRQLVGIAGECMEFLLAVTPEPTDKTFKLSMCNLYLQANCGRLKLLNDCLLGNVTERYRKTILNMPLAYLRAAWKTLYAVSGVNAARIAWTKLLIYFENWSDAFDPAQALQSNGVAFRAKADRDWNSFLEALNAAANGVGKALADAQAEKEPSKAKREKDGPPPKKTPKKRSKRHKLLMLDYNAKLKKFGYEVKADRKTVLHNGEPYLLTAPKVIDAVNDMIIQLCNAKPSPHMQSACIRFTSEHVKNFTRGSYREFLDKCIVRNPSIDKDNPPKVITNPVARLRLPSDE